MRVLLVLALVLACVGVALAAPIGDNVNLMSPEEQYAYQQYLHQLQSVDFRNSPFDDSTPFVTSAYDALDQLDVNCPSQTFGLAIPPRHIKFWRSYPLTHGLGWSVIKSEHVKVLCVPHHIRLALAPLVEKIATERMINVDPLTVPQVVSLADKIVKRTVISQQQIQPTNQIDDRQIDEMETSGLHGGLGWGGLGFGRGFGWGGLGGLGGWGFGYPGFGFRRFGWGYPGWGLGGGGGGLGWGYPGAGYGGLIL